VTECLFCKIAQGETQADVVFEDGDVVAIRDINPQTPVHVLVIPRKHIVSFSSLTEGDEWLVGKIARTAAHIAEHEGIAESGYRCVVNNGPQAQQSVPHLHMHVLGGRQMSWPPG
jgi:histidine triad (HIT) family protein